LYFLSVKLGQPFAPSRLLDALASVGAIELSDMGRAQLEKLELLPEIPEMHDRLIAAESIALDAPVLTRDESIAASNQIETVW
jgi:PIN domain nuclease of toxin-antitoxin system